MNGDPLDDPAEPVDLGELLAELAGELVGASIEPVAGGVEYRNGDRPFAAVGDGWAEFALHPDVAEAALRTADAARSPRGPSWVRFTPPQVDRFALDRAEAWFLSAWRASAPLDRR